MADDIKSPFVQPLNHVPAELKTPFVKPTDHVPEGIIGDTLDEIRPRFEGGGQHLPAEAYTLFIGGTPHVPAGAVDLVGDQVPHVPSGIIGDQPEEIQPAPPIVVSPPPAPGPESTPNPLGHVPAEPVIPVLPHPPVVARDPIVLPDMQPHVPAEPNYDVLVKRLRFSDSTLSSYLEKIGLDSYGVPGAPGSQALDPELYVKYLFGLGQTMGRSGMLQFIGTQSILHMMNSRNAKIFDPKYFIERMPYLNSLLRTTIDTQTHEEMVNLVEALGVQNLFSNGQKDKHEDSVFMKDRQKISEEVEALEQLNSLEVTNLPIDGIREKNMYAPGNTYSESPVSTIAAVVNAALDDIQTQDDATAKQLLEFSNDTGFRKFKASAFFEQDPKRTFLQSPKTQYRAGSTTGRASIGGGTELYNSSFHKGVIPMGFRQDDADGVIRTRGDDLPSSVIDDDEAYVPLSFTDLRTTGDEYRTIYFRPIITSFSEGFAPNWAEDDGYFGRVDPVARYRSTKRTISLGFELHAFSPEDLKVIYNKLHWLQSLVYPEIDQDFLFKSGPVCRMRVGDIISSKGHGLGGYISTLEFDYTDSIWELKKGMKVPRSIPVSLSFVALHDGPVGLRGSRFGVNVLPNGDIESEQEAAEIGRARFRGFGEPEEQ